jgi:hypothetical protein
MILNKPKHVAEQNKLLCVPNIFCFTSKQTHCAISALEQQTAGIPLNTFSLSQLAVTDVTAELTAMTVRSC